MTTQEAPSHITGQGLLGFHHVAIIACNYDASKAFYAELLGFRILRETYRQDRDSYKLDLGLPNGDTIELFSFPDPPVRPTNPEAAGLRHLAFAVTNVESVAAALREAGTAVEPIRVDPTTGAHYTFFKDPDGLPLELYEVQAVSRPSSGYVQS
jgi:glyoxylase I family protein